MGVSDGKRDLKFGVARKVADEVRYALGDVRKAQVSCPVTRCPTNPSSTLAQQRTVPSERPAMQEEEEEPHQMSPTMRRKGRKGVHGGGEESPQERRGGEMLITLIPREEDKTTVS